MIDPQSSAIEEVYKALDLLRPFDLVGEEKRRYGRTGDGAYILIERLIGDIFYSFGVAQEVSFEVAMAETGRRGYLFDHTVDGMPVVSSQLSFSKRGIAAASGIQPNLCFLGDFLRENGHEGRGDLLLKLDTEGAEYDVLAGMPQDLLCSFQQIALELHDLRLMADPGFRSRLVSVLSRLNADFVICHVHANNCAPVQAIYGLPVADVLELTYVRRDLVQVQPSATVYPTTLDCSNDPDRPDLPLLFHPFLPLPDHVRSETSAAVARCYSSVEFEANLRQNTQLSPHQRKVALFGLPIGKLHDKPA